MDMTVIRKKNERKLIIYIAASLDGYIAKPNDDLSFLKVVQVEGEDYGYSEFINSIDTVIIGRKTFDWVCKEISGFPHPDKNTYVITKTARPDKDKTKFYTGNLKDLVFQLKQKEGKNIFCDGGAEVITMLLKDNLIDEMIISIIPILLGGGTKLFKEGWSEKKLKLISTKSYNSGLVQVYYKIL
jgi:dihydrofolate reductase